MARFISMGLALYGMASWFSEKENLFLGRKEPKKRIATLVDRVRLGFVCILPLSDNPVSSLLFSKE